MLLGPDGRPISTHAPKAPSSAAAATMATGGGRLYSAGQRRDVRTLRRYSEQNVWVRSAIDRRKHDLTRSKWSVVRIDDPKAQPDPRVEREARELFTFVNPTGASLSTVIAMLVEDILVVDAGCLEIETTAKGKIAALWPLDGGEIRPDPSWDGSDPNKPRYSLYRNGRHVADYWNDELIYMMANPRSCSPVGRSPLEVLFDTVEADLYGEDFEYRRLRETAPAGLLYLGTASAEEVMKFRALWESELAGKRDVAIFGTDLGDFDDGVKPSSPTFIPFSRSSRDEMHREYFKWLAIKVATAFRQSLLGFNLSDTIHKSVGETLQTMDDESLLALGGTIESHLTREVMWRIDPSHRHGFKFVDLTKRDALAQAKLDESAMKTGRTTPNELRKRDGDDPFPDSVRPDGTPDPTHWANLPYPFAQFGNQKLDPRRDDYPEEDPDEDPDAKS
jgi:hypothetical protein